MERIKNEKELIQKLEHDIKESNKNKIILISGHFPLLYSKESKIAIEAFAYWGEFSLYTLELSCIVGEYARKLGRAVKFIFSADDHAYEERGGLLPNQRSSRRSNLYKQRSGADASLSPEYKKIMNKYGFSEADVVRHDHGKPGRNDCLYFSEKVLRASAKNIDNACAREYTELLEDAKYFDKKQSYLIAFMPKRCRGHICDVALDKEIEGVSASHIFMETLIPDLTREDLFNKGDGVTYRKD